MQNSISDVSDFSKMLSNDVLQREHDEPINKEEIILRRQLHGLEVTYRELDTNWNNLVNEHNKMDDKNSRQLLSKKIDEVTWQRNVVTGLLSQCKLKLSKKNLQKYNHPDKVFCPINRLPAFINLHNAHLDDKL